MQLTKRETKTLLSVASVVIPPGGSIPYSFADIPLLDFVNRFFPDVPKHIQWLFRFNLWFIEYCSWVFIFRPLRFSRAAHSVKEKILRQLFNSRFFFIRGIYVFTSLLILVPFYNDQRVLQNIGYTP